jgi:hypothetical protein
MLLFVANGQWDARLECVVNAALHAATAVLVYLWGSTAFDPRWRTPWLVVVGLLTAVPIDNILDGFHSQQYLLVAFSLAAISLLTRATVFSPRWWIGVACLVLALSTMASGLLAAAVVAATILLTTRSGVDARRNGLTLAACTLVLLLGLLLHPWHFVNENPYEAGSLAEFIAAFRRYLGWPFERVFGYRNVRMAILPQLTWLPWLWITWRVVRLGPQVATRELVLFAIGAWTLLQFAASAYARGADAPWPSIRYLDNLFVGIGVNVAAFFLMVTHSSLAGWRRRAWLGAVATGLCFTAFGLAVHVTWYLDHGLPDKRDHLIRATANTRAYLLSGDPACLQATDLPHPRADALAEYLSHPEIRAILPVSLQPPPGRMGPLSRLAQALARSGPGIAGLGLAMLGFVLWRAAHGSRQIEVSTERT